MSDMEYDNQGQGFFLGACQKAYTYEGDNVKTITAVAGTVTRVKTFTWDGDQLTAESQWVVQ